MSTGGAIETFLDSNVRGQGTAHFVRCPLDPLVGHFVIYCTQLLGNMVQSPAGLPPHQYETPTKSCRLSN